MKKILWAVAGFVFLSISAPAQVAPTNEEMNASHSRLNKYARVMPINKMDQRKIYHWRNGQRSTPMGRATGSPNAKYAKVYGDSAMVVAAPATPPSKAVSSNAFKNARTIHICQLDQRMIYNWANGQRSTPMGRVTGRRNVEYVKVMGDRAVVVSGYR